MKTNLKQNLCKWPTKARRGVMLGALAGVVITASGYALYRWVDSHTSHGGDGGGFLIGLPAISPLLPLGYIVFGGHLPRKWVQGDSIWQAYALAMLLNTLILAAIGGVIGYFASLFPKNKQ